MMRLTWKKQARETGLRSIGSGPRGYDLNLDGEQIAAVRANGGNWTQLQSGWYWHGGNDKTGRRNTYSEKLLFPTIDAAKESCRAWINSQLRKP